MLIATLVTALLFSTAPVPADPARASVPARTASDTLVVTNSHPHEMKIVLVTDSGEKELGTAAGHATTRLVLELPRDTKELKLKASFALMDGMEVTTTLPLEPGKTLVWSF